jgi:hypothetical protein
MSRPFDPAAHPLASHIESCLASFDASHDTLTLMLSEQQLQAWLDKTAPSPWTDPRWRALEDRRRVHLVLDHASCSPRHGVDDIADRLIASVASVAGAEVEVRVLVLRHGVEDASPHSPLDQLAEDLSAPIFEALRRDTRHFERAPLIFGPTGTPSVHLLERQAVLDFIAHQLGLFAPGMHLLQAHPLCTSLEMMLVVAQACMDSPASRGQADSAVAELMRLAMTHHHNRHDQPLSLQTKGRIHTLPAPTIDWRRRAAEAVQRCRAAMPALRPASLDTLGGLQWHAASDGSVQYLRCGRGPQAVLLINAFGQTEDVWHDLIQAIAPHATVLMLPDGLSPGAEAHARSPSYAHEHSVRQFVGDVEVMLATEELRFCHVASWCAGSKFAIELARALPDTIASLSLFAPSFAGTAQTSSGADSAFESSLHTLCQLVRRMPQSAESMARSMVASISKSTGMPPADLPDAAAGAAHFGLHDAACQHWLQRPFSSAQAMVLYSRQLLNFRAHEVVGPPEQPRLDLPVLLVTADQDTTTCSRRARDLCASLCEPIHFELRHAGHYFVHQNSALTGRLLLDFMRDGSLVQAPHPRLRHLPLERDAELLFGEL